MEVYALVGPSGTGKSHRAARVAHEYNIDLIVDDGLLIQVRDAKILAGSSAKREDTKVAAVRRAIFADADHAVSVREALYARQPQRVLVLGTSPNMIGKIVTALHLPDPARTIAIEEIATPQEIRRARRMRNELGKHVIPAPTFEVKKTFSGYLIDPLRFFLRNKKNAQGEPEWVEKSMVRPTFSSLGRFFIADRVVAAIAQRAAGEVAGVARVLGVRVESGSDGVQLGIDLALRYGVVLGPVLEEVQRQVKERVEYMTALNVLAVDVYARRLALDDRVEREVNR